jgi:hypothetical protein
MATNGDPFTQSDFEALPTVEEIGREVNAIERILDRFRGDDEYAEAQLRYMRAALKLQVAQSEGRIDTSNLPRGLIGRASDDLPEGSTGPAIFEVPTGGQYRAEVTATEDIQSNESLIITGPRNEVERGASRNVKNTGTSLSGTSLVSEATDAAGEDDAAAIELGAMRADFDIVYTLDSNAGDIVIEHSLDGDEWFPIDRIDSGSLPAGGETDTIQADSKLRFARVYVTDDFADDDVKVLKLASKGA